jgi:hypothetical protein
VRALPAAPDLVVCGDHSADRGTGSTPAFLAGLLGAAQALGLVQLSTVEGELRALRRLDGGRRERLVVPLPAVCSVEPTGVRLRRAALPAVLAAATAPIPVVAADPVSAANSVVAADPVSMADPVVATDPVRVADPVSVADPVVAADPVSVANSGSVADPVVAAGREPTPAVSADPVPARIRAGVPVAYRPRPKALAPPEGADPRQRLLALAGAPAERTPSRVVTPAGPAEAADELLNYLRQHGYLRPS